VALPETVANLVRTRLQGLSKGLRQVLETAAVVGAEMRFETLQKATGVSESKLEALVEEATRRLLLRDRGVSRGNDYRFANETLRQVLYNDMPRRRRKRAHRKVVTALHKLYRDDLDRLSPVLAYHHHAVGDWRETLHWSTQALAAALERSDNDAAATVQSWAEDALAGARRVSSNERDRLELYSGMLFRRLGQLENATLRLLQVSEREETPLGVLARLELARCHMARGDLEAAVEITRGAGRAAEQLSESDSLHEARLLEATCLLRLGQSQPAAALLDTLLASLGDRGPRTVRSLAHRERAWAFLNSGAFQEAQRHARRAHELARMAGDLLAQHHAVSALAAVLSNSGDPAGAVPLNRQALDLARRLSLRRREAIDLANLGELHYELRDPDQALDHFREALAIFVEIGDRACEGDCRVNVGRAMLARGDGHEALAMLQRGRALCESTGRAEYAGIALLHEGEAHLALGDPRGANAAYTEAQERFAEIDSHHLWRADLGRAQAERARGRQETALELARRAAQRVESQRTNLPAEAHSSGFDQAASAVSELIEAIESR
ncbi:MAG: tetratricopeptide repeat protein, partial [Acidobacteriota bacterium]